MEANDAVSEAIFFDGLTSRRRLVRVVVGPQLVLHEAGVPVAAWNWADIRPADTRGTILRLTSITAPQGAKLDVFDDTLKREIVARCDLLMRPVRRDRLAPAKMIALSFGALGSLVFLLWIGIPYGANRIAPLVPVAWEARLGDATVSQVRTIFPSKTCAGAEGRAALDKLTDALSRASTLPMPVTIEVLSSPVVNAFALPGGKVYVLDGLLQKSANADELAGVLGHEFGHVRHRDAMRRLIAEGSTAYLVGLLFGDVSGAGALLFTTRTLLGAAYSRNAEADADAHALAVMSALGRPAKAMGELLVRIDGKNDPGALDLLRDHPLSGARLEALSRDGRGATGPELLTDAEWRALQAICR